MYSDTQTVSEKLDIVVRWTRLKCIKEYIVGSVAARDISFVMFFIIIYIGGTTIAVVCRFFFKSQHYLLLYSSLVIAQSFTCISLIYVQDSRLLWRPPLAVLHMHYFVVLLMLSKVIFNISVYIKWEEFHKSDEQVRGMLLKMLWNILWNCIYFPYAWWNHKPSAYVLQI